MQQDSEGRVRVMQCIAVAHDLHCLRLCMEDATFEAAVPGQYCLLAEPGQPPRAYSYVSLPGRDGCFMVAVPGAGAAVTVGGQLDYRGPLGSGWPLPLRASRLLLMVADGGLLSLAALVDEVGCWMPWLRLHLLCDDACLECLPPECRGWLHSLGLPSVAVPQSRRGTLFERLALQLAAQLPDLVFCAGSDSLNRATARLCLLHGMPAARIWLHAERLPGGFPREVPADGPVYRFDRYPRGPI